MPKLCHVHECGRKVRSLGLCAGHYTRQRRHGFIDDTPLGSPRSPKLPVIDHEDGTRTCASCGERKDRTSGFHADKKAPLGRRKQCKDCRVAIETSRYNSDPEAYREKTRVFRVNNTAHVRAREARYYRENRETRIKSAVKHAYIRRDRIESRPKDKGISLKSLHKRYGNACYFCHDVLDFNKNHPAGGRPDNLATIDHLTPISRGGTHTWDNCVLACWRCNATKGTMTEAEFTEGLTTHRG